MAEAQRDYARFRDARRIVASAQRPASIAATFAPSRAQLNAIAFVAFVAMLLRLGPLAAVRGADRLMDPNGDSQAYVELARGLEHGCGFARFVNGRCLAAETNRTPGYPLLLEMMRGVNGAVAAQAVLAGMVTLAAGGFVAGRWGASAGMLSAMFIALDLPSIVLSDEIMTEALFTALFTFGILLELRALRSAGAMRDRVLSMLAASAFFAYAILARPIGEFAMAAPILIALTPPAATLRRRLGYALLVISLPAALIAGWSVRNYHVTGDASFSTIGGLNFFYYRAGGTLAYATGKPWEAELGKLPAPDHGEMVPAALAIIARHPAAFVRMTVWSLLYVSVVPERGPLSHLLGIQRTFGVEEPGSMRATAALREFKTSPRAAFDAIYRDEFHSSPIVLALTVFQIVLTLLMWAGVIAVLRFAGLRTYRDFCIAAFIVSALVLLLLAAGPEATARFRVPAIPFLAMAAGVGLSGAARIGKAPAAASRIPAAASA